MSVRPRSLRRLSFGSALGAVCALTAACGSGTGARDDDAEVLPVPALGDARLQLERAVGCDDLLTRIQDSTLVQLELRAEQLKQGEGAAFGGPGTGSGGATGIGVGNTVGSSEPPRAAPTDEANGGFDVGSSAPGSAGDSADNPGAPAPATPPSAGGASAGGGFSATTVQVKDVDEADIVKTDGDDIYLLHGGTLFVLRGWPADATEVLGSRLIEGMPTEMFVKDGKAVVFSNIYGDLSSVSSGAAGSGYSSSSYTKISVLDVSSGTPAVVRESYVEGSYTSARRHGDIVRAVVQNGFKIPQFAYPTIEYRDAFGDPYPQTDVDDQVDAWLERTARSIRRTDLGDWLPREFAKQNGGLVAVAPRCGDYYSPDPGLTETGVTSVVALDLADVSAPLAGATILGRAERVYSNEEALLLTQTDYRYSYDTGAAEQTIIHRFDIAGANTTYVASGAVAGSIQSQFSLDERNGIIRVSTTEQAFGRGGGGPPIDLILTPAPPPSAAPGGSASSAGDTPASGGSSGKEAPATDPSVAAPVPSPVPSELPAMNAQPPSSVSRVVTLQTVGDTLELLGTTADFGANESIFSTRFIGDRGYVVTFRQTDPLFVVDLSDPADPRVVGELAIPGFSNYLFPLDDEHLFAIGRDATAQGVVQGLALQIFDVSDATRPTLSQRYVFPDLGDSPANVDHRAISFHADRGVVAFPHQSYITGESTLEVFQISAETGFTRLGAAAPAQVVDFDRCLAQYYGYGSPADIALLRSQVEADPAWEAQIRASCNDWQYFRRGLFRDDFVYGISNTGVSVYDITAMGEGAVGQLDLPAEVYDGKGYAGGGTSGGVALPGSVGPVNVATPVPDAPAPSSPAPAADAGAAAPAE